MKNRYGDVDQVGKEVAINNAVRFLQDRKCRVETVMKTIEVSHGSASNRVSGAVDFLRKYGFTKI